MTTGNEKMLPRRSHSLGYTRLEIGFALLLVVFGALLAVTKFRDLSVVVDGSMDQGIVDAVQQGISAYALESKEGEGDSSPYPSVLDEADIGDASPQNLFFFYVLPNGIAVEGWAKTDRYEYRAPSGETYIYDPHTGTFDAQAGTTDTPLDDPAKSD